MSERTVSIEVPESTYGKLKRAAELTHRSVDEMLTSTIDAALVAPPDLPQGLSIELAAMNMMSDSALFLALNPNLATQKYKRFQQLNEEAQKRDLTQAEEAEQDRLLDLYQQAVLRRAQAMAILHQRGHELSREELEKTMLKLA